MKKNKPELEAVGFDLNAWVRAVGFSRAKYYGLPPELAPRSVLIGRQRIIIEKPAEYLARMAARGTGPTQRAA